MRINIILDKEQPTYTSLDTVSGKVCLHVPRAVAVSSVTAKLEGESRTRLRLTNDMGEAAKTRLEIHKVCSSNYTALRTSLLLPLLIDSWKVLYKVSTVFPDRASRDGNIDRVKYNLEVGYYEFKFSFKVMIYILNLKMIDDMTKTLFRYHLTTHVTMLTGSILHQPLDSIPFLQKSPSYDLSMSGKHFLPLCRGSLKSLKLIIISKPLSINLSSST